MEKQIAAEETPARRQAQEDIEAAFSEWQPHDRQFPLHWTADEMLSYWTEAAVDDDIGRVRLSEEYAEAIEDLLPSLLREEREGFERQAAQYWIARRGLPGSEHFSYSIHDNEASARVFLALFADEAETVSERETVRLSAVMRGDACIWDVFRSGKCIYVELLKLL